MSIERPEDIVYCNLCKPPHIVETSALIEHFRVVHGEVVEFQTWPDGEPVILDLTLEPDDFEASA